MATTPTSTGVLDRDPIENQEAPVKKDRTHWLYIMVIIAVVAGAAIGLMAPDVGKALKPLGTGFVALIKMIIAPVNVVVTP
ncbi:cation:dicarboxylase symporter family transporter [Arthrobacter sp. AQ5-05]|uniref:cation:dicarboxylate symporter family transporter n=1 Tax=Arthrobacter sp. AQ5-05 TaxID=2184581 RepID=UPI002688D470